MQNTEIWVYSEEIRQYFYCPRIIYFRRVLEIKPSQTYRMQKGSKFHLDKIGYNYQNKNSVAVYYDLHLSNEKLCWAGVIDAVIEYSDSILPIEYKLYLPFNNVVPKGHVYQLFFLASLATKYFESKIEIAEIIYKNGKQEKITFPKNAEQILNDVIFNIRQIILTEELPDPTPDSEKCKGCEYWRYCLRA